MTSSRISTTEFSALRLELAEALRELENQLSALLILLGKEKSSGQIAIAFDPSSNTHYSGTTAWDRIISQIKEIEYRDEQDAREAFILPGVASVTQSTIEQAKQLNRAKDRFQHAFTEINRYVSTSENTRDARKQVLAKRTLAEMGHARLHLKQTYRHLVTIEHRPDRIGFTWTRTDKIERITLAKAYQMAARYKEHINYDWSMAKLDALDANESLAYKEDPHVHVRANLLWKPTPERDRLTIQKRASLPLLLLGAPGQTLPAISGLAPYQKKTRQKRNDQQLEDVAYIPLLRLYRYNLTKSKNG